jgi:TPR repeat protein
MYRYGVGVEQNLGEAFRWISQAADRGNPIADSYLADMYEQGLGSERNFRKALEYYNKAARKRFGPAENGLGMMYFCGEGVRQDFERSTEWYRKAMRDGSNLAAVNLAFAYENGLGEPRDPTEAASLLEESRKGLTLAKSRSSKLIVPSYADVQIANIVRDSCLLRVPQRKTNATIGVKESPSPLLVK